MRDDDDLDLSAWDVPPPPDGLADAVIARMGGTAVGLAMPAHDDEPRRRRYVVIAASAAAVLVATLGTWIIVRGREHAPPTSGEVVATRAQHLELGGVTADLDRGADVTWRRDGGRVQIDQKAGTAVWRVGGDQQVVIGAAVASIDAAGASLRVEVPMNMSDARVIGASTITAAAVAMVTVVVYEGHVKVTSGGQTVVVQPGATFTVPPPAPPPEPPVVGVAPLDTPHAGKRSVAVLGLDGGDHVARDLTEGLRARAKVGIGPLQLAPGSDKELTDEKILHNCESEAPACMAQIGDDLGADVLVYGQLSAQRAGYQIVLRRFDVHRKLVERALTDFISTSESDGAALQGRAKQLWVKLTDDESPLTSEQINEVMRAHAHDVQGCFQQHPVPGNVVIDLSIAPDGSVASAVPAETPDGALGTCVANAVAGFGFPRSSGRTRVKYPFAFTASTCDAKALEDKGVEAEGAGQHLMALGSFEQALKCTPGEERLVKLAFMASCELKSTDKARKFWHLLSDVDQSRLLQICLRVGITKDELDDGGPACDADALEEKGITAEGAGQHARALADFEQALKCKPGVPRLVSLAFMSACQLRDVTKARRYWRELPSARQPTLLQMCMRQGITQDDLEGGGGVPAAEGGGAPAAPEVGALRLQCNPPAMIMIDGKDTGQTTPAVVKVTPGKHKVTFVLGGDRFTYPVEAKAGETATISKDLR